MRCLFSSCISCGVIVVPSVLVVISSSVQFVFCVELVEIVSESLCQGTPYKSVSVSVVCSVFVNMINVR